MVRVCYTHIQPAERAGKKSRCKRKPILASHNQFLNSSTAEGVESITLKPILFFNFSSLWVYKVESVEAHFHLRSVVFSPGLDYPTDTHAHPSAALLSSYQPSFYSSNYFFIFQFHSLRRRIMSLNGRRLGR